MSQENQQKTDVYFCNACKSLTFLCPGCGKWHHVKKIIPSGDGTVELVADDSHLITITYSEFKRVEEWIADKKG